MAIQREAGVGIGHELRHQGARILGYLELLKDEDPGPLNSDQAAMLATVEFESRRLLTLSQELLLMVELARGILAPDSRPVAAGTLVTTAIEDCDWAAAERETTLQQRTEPDVWLNGDLDLLRVLVSRVITNLVTLTERRGSIDIHAYPEDHGVAITVTGRPVTLPNDQPGPLLTRHLHPTVRSDTSVPARTYGKTFVEQLTALHGGRVEVGTSDNQTAWVRLHLPTIAPEAGAADQHRTHQPVPVKGRQAD